MKSLCFGFVCLSMLASCGGDGGSDKNKDLNPDKFTGINTLEVDESVVYQSDCMMTKDDGVETYSMTRFEIKMLDSESAAVSMNQAIFTEKCEIPLLETEIEGEGSLMLNNTFLRTQMDSVSMRPLHSEMTSYMNNDSTCGFNDWETMTMKDITNTDCVEGEMSGDVYINARNNGAHVTLYMCEEHAPLNNKCQKFELKKM